MQTQEYSFRHYVEHRAAHGQADVLFHALEQTPFLADQAARLGSFRQGTEDLLSFVLPLAIRNANWNRFLRFVLVAYNTAGLAETLGSREILWALVSNGWPRLAFDVAAQLQSPWARLQAFAAIAGSAEQPVWRDKAVESLHSELQVLPPPQEDEDLLQLALSLREVARDLPSQDWPGGEQMPDILEDWPDLEDRIWQAAVEGCSQRGDWRQDQLWRFLDRIRDTARLRDTLLSLIGEGEPGFSLTDLVEHLYVEREDVFWPTCAVFLSRQARESMEEALWHWNRIVGHFAVPWSIEIIEHGRDLFGRMDTAEVASLAATLPEEETKAALWLCAIAYLADPERLENALAVVQELEGSSSLIWALRLLRLDKISPADDIRRRTEALRLRLFEAGYPLPAQELASFLDLVAEVLPDRLAGELENVVSRVPDLETLEEVASLAVSSRVIEELFERAETLTCRMAREGEDELLSAGRTLTILAAHLCIQKCDLGPLHNAVARLPPAWHDELRALVAGELFRAGNQELAQRALYEIRSPRERLRSLLELFPQQAGEALRKPGFLYEAMARIDSIADERNGIQSLLVAPIDFGRSVELVKQITPGPLAVVAELRLGRRGAVLKGRGVRGTRDDLGLLHLLENLLETGSFARDSWLLPEILEIGARLNGANLDNEARNAAEELFALSPGDGGGEALERLVAHLQAVLPDDQLTRVLLALLTTLERLPVEARRAWVPEGLPLLTAAAERLPAGPPGRLRKKLRSLAERSLGEQPPTGDEQLAIRLCGAERSQRRQVGRELCESEGAFPRASCAAAYLLSTTDPAAAAALVLCAAPGTDRDALCRRLVQYGWLPSAEARGLVDQIRDSGVRAITELFLLLRGAVGEPDRAWLPVLETCIARVGVDPAEPRFSPLVERLWQGVPDSALQALAHAALGALRTETSRGEQAVRLWLHAYLAPIEDASPEALRRGEEVAQVFRQASALVPSPPLLAGTDQEKCEARPEQLAHAFQRWRRASFEGEVWEWKKQGSFAKTNIFLVVAILFILPDIELVPHGSASWGWPLRLFAWYHTSPVWLLIFVLYPINAFVLDRLQAGETPYQDLRCPWLPKLRFLLGGIPVLGLYTVPAWQWLLRSRPRWAFASQTVSPLATTPGTGPDFTGPTWFRRLLSRNWSLSPQSLIGLWVVNLLVLRLATSRLTAAELLTPHRREILCLILHDLGCLATAFTIGVQAGAWRLRRRDMLIPLALTSTWLLAFPLPLAALSAFAYPAVRRWGAGTLTASTQRARVPAEWAGLLRALKERAREIPWRKRPWGLETTPFAGAVQTRFLTLCRIKAFLLFFDGALIFFLAWKIAHTTTLATALAVLFLYFSFLFVVLLSGLGGVAASWIEDGRRLIRTGAFLGNDGEPQPYGRSLMINAGACVSGGILGYGIGTGNGFLFGGWLMLIGFMGAFHVVPPAYRLKGAGVTYGQALRTLVLRVLLFIAIFLLGTVAFKGGKPAGTLACWFTTLSVLAPAWALITGFFLRNRLLEPFRARDAMSPHLPWLCRWTLAVFLLTLILPLGGLTIPLWIWARARLWPVWERNLLHEVPSQ